MTKNAHTVILASTGAIRFPLTFHGVYITIDKLWQKASKILNSKSNHFKYNKNFFQLETNKFDDHQR